MKKNHNYEINWKTNTITVTPRYLEAASQMGTEAFEEIQRLRSFGLPLVEREIHRRPKVAKWSYKQMEKYLKHVENADKWQAEYQVMKDSSTHGEVWSWFRKTFIRVDNKGRRILPTFTADHKFAVPTPIDNITPIGHKKAADGAKTEPNADTPEKKRA